MQSWTKVGNDDAAAVEEGGTRQAEERTKKKNTFEPSLPIIWVKAGKKMLDGIIYYFENKSFRVVFRYGK